MKKVLSTLLAVTLLLSFTACSKKQEDPDVTEPVITTTEAPVFTNPLTGKTGYNEAAVGKRPAAIVIENSPDARPQWGMKSADIVVEGEVEGGITRMLWLFADYTAVPSKMGPTRSARPSYVKISQWFDGVFVHWGGSASDGPYVGGYETIKKMGVNDLDGMKGGELFGRDTTRSTALEHRGIIHGDKLAKVLKDKKIRTDIKSEGVTEFKFFDERTELSDKSAVKVNLKFASTTATRVFNYSKKDKKYHCNDWENDASFTNLLILKSPTDRYTVGKKNTTYVNYQLAGGDGVLVSNGTKLAVTWAISGNKVTVKDKDGKEVKLNVGKTYIGMCSSDDGGKVGITPAPETTTEAQQ